MKTIDDPCGFTKTLSHRPIKTATVYKANNLPFAKYTTEIAVDVAEDIGGYVVSDETGEITYTSRKLRIK